MSDAAVILHAQIAADRLIERTSTEQRAVMALSRDEVSAIAQQMKAVAHIAERLYLDRGGVGSLPPDAFPEPTT